jgi:very-short-patch-repair endonuclease
MKKKGANADFIDKCRSEGLPDPVTEHRFHPVRKWRFDYAWPEHFVALEVEGGVWIAGRHTRGSGYIGDMEKYSEAAALGWRILRVQPKDLRTQKTIDLLRRCICS